MRLTPRRIRLIRCVSRIAVNQIHLIERNRQLLRHQLCLRRRDALTEFLLAAVCRDRPVGPDGNPRIQLPEWRRKRHWPGKLAIGNFPHIGETEPHNHRPRGLQESPPRQSRPCLFRQTRLHRTPPAAYRRIAAIIRVCVKQRHSTPDSACSINCSLGCGTLSTSAFADSIAPLMQKPHCAAPSPMNACCSGCGLSAVPRPSSVVISLSPTALTGITQDRITCPRMMTVHDPHCAIPHPKRGPRSPRSSFKTNNSGVSGSASTRCSWPLTLRIICIYEILSRLLDNRNPRSIKSRRCAR